MTFDWAVFAATVMILLIAITAAAVVAAVKLTKIADREEKRESITFNFIPHKEKEPDR